MASVGPLVPFDWERAAAARALASREETKLIAPDPLLVAQILGRKTPGRLARFSSVIPLPWVVLVCGFMMVPVLLWYYDRITARADRRLN